MLINSRKKMGHNKSPPCIKVGLKKGPWSPEEDRKLLDYIEKHGLGSWRALPAKAGLWRCGKSCRLRWRNYLRPDIKRGEFSLQEEQTIIQLHALLGNRWSVIANHLPRRTDNEIKNHWNTHLKKRLTKMGIDPVTHKRKTYAVGSSIINNNNDNQSKEAANINHLAQWETARLEAEGRLASMSSSKLLHLSASANNNNYNPLTKTTTTAYQRPPCLDVLRASQQGAYAWMSTKPNNNNNNNNNFLITSPLIFGGSSSDDDGFGAIPQTNLLYSSCFGNSSIINSTSTTTYEVLGIAEEEHVQNNNNNRGGGLEVEEIIRVHGRFIPSHVAGSNLELSAAGAGFMETFAGDLSSSSSSSCPSNYALQQWIEGTSDHLNCPTGFMY